MTVILNALQPSVEYAIARALVPLTLSTAADNAADLQGVATHESRLETQCLYGERFRVSDHDGPECTGTLVTDGYEGVIPLESLQDAEAVTHRIIVPQTIVTATPSVKSEYRGILYYGSQVRVLQSDSDCVSISFKGGQAFVPEQDVAPVDNTVTDWVADAESFLGRPYLWGGRSAAGIDCSALVQLTIARAGLQLPRNSSDQYRHLAARENMEAYGTHLPLQRGDLVFWVGHVGIMQDDGRLLHANAWHRRVHSEPLAQACERIERQGGGNMTGWARP